MAIKLNMTLDELQDDSIRQDPAAGRRCPSWCVLLALLVLHPGGRLLPRLAGPARTSSRRARAKEDKLQGGVPRQEDSRRSTSSLHRSSCAEIDNPFGALLKQLPNKSRDGRAAVDINQAAWGAACSSNCSSRRRAEIAREFYAELPISIKVTGNYHDIGAFASDVASCRASSR